MDEDAEMAQREEWILSKDKRKRKSNPSTRYGNDDFSTNTCDMSPTVYTREVLKKDIKNEKNYLICNY